MILSIDLYLNVLRLHTRKFLSKEDLLLPLPSLAQLLPTCSSLTSFSAVTGPRSAPVATELPGEARGLVRCSFCRPAPGLGPLAHWLLGVTCSRGCHGPAGATLGQPRSSIYSSLSLLSLPLSSFSLCWPLPNSRPGGHWAVQPLCGALLGPGSGPGPAPLPRGRFSVCQGRGTDLWLSLGDVPHNLGLSLLESVYRCHILVLRQVPTTEVEGKPGGCRAPLAQGLQEEQQPR